ncbi:MAG: MBG domain-containing protein, partial [Bacteroidota bacterium]
MASLGITGEAEPRSTYDASSAANRGAGTYPITIEQNTLAKSNDAAGNYAFNLQPGALTIAKAALTLTADDQTREYGEANPELTLTPTGLAYDDSVESSLSGSLLLSTTATATTNVGNHLIDLGIGTAVFANYDVVQLVDGTLSVTKAPLTITMEDATKIYGNPLAAGYPYVMTGFKNGETEAGLRTAGALSGTVLYSTAATQASPVGTYTLNPLSVDLTATNYSFNTLAPGVLTITPRGLVVSASPSREYGLSNDPSNITWNTVITGFVNGDTQVGVVTGEPALIGVPGITANAGIYAITLAQGTLSAGPNYDLTTPATTYNAANFTIRQATSLR